MKKLEHNIIYSLFKRMLDIIISLILIVILSPLYIIISLLIKLDSKGPIIFKQVRVGKNKKEFTIYKFRTMFYNSNELFNDFSIKIKNKFYENYKLDDDKRITKFGKVIRNNFIDELPQLYNVLKGDMSLIGPRPILPKETKKYGKYRDDILSIKPGMTGYWACHNTKDISYSDRTLLEYYYIMNYSFLLDIKITYYTIRRLLGFGKKYINK